MYKFIKKVIDNIIPYGIRIRLILSRNKKTQFLHLEKDRPDFPDCDSKFDYIVSVEGFGFSGSGAIVDLLREYPCCLTFGSIDKEGSKTQGEKLKNGEIDFLRHAGGLFEIEKYLDEGNLFIKDAMIKRFKRLVESNEFFNSEAAKNIVNRFYNQLVDFEIDTKGHNDYNWHLRASLYPDPNIKIMREITLDQYRVLCRRLISSLFNLYYKKCYNYLVLDQLCNDLNFLELRNKQYIPNLKTIVVYRDPRDTYCYAIQKDVPWIPHDTVDRFVRWYKKVVSRFDCNAEDYLVVRFEELVYDYEKVVKVVEKYLGLNEEHHTHKKECFDPQESSKNISLWKSFEGYQKDFDIIKEKLPNYCFFK